MYFEWNEEKNKWLKATRDVSFDEVENALHTGGLLDEDKHPNQVLYPHQRILIVFVNNYVCVVPYVRKNRNTFFLKTIYQSRKYNKKYF